MRNSAGAVLIFCPFLAAVVAYDVSRRVNPTLAEIARGSSRGTFAAFLPMTAAFLWALAATAVTWLAIGIAASLAGGIGASDPWIYLETMSAYAAAAAVGTLVGNHVRGVTSVAVAAGIVLAAAMVLAGQGIKVFQVASNWGTMIGVERTPARAAIAIALNLSIALLCVGVAGLTSGVRRPSRFAVGGLAIPLVASLVIAVTLPIRDSEYRPSREAQACVGSSPVVCGPARAADLLRGAQRDLAVSQPQSAHTPWHGSYSSCCQAPKTVDAARGLDHRLQRCPNPKTHIWPGCRAPELCRRCDARSVIFGCLLIAEGSSIRW